MRKTFSSTFMLLILFLILWALSSWYLGEKNKQRFSSLFKENQNISNDIIRYDLISSSSSIFGTKAKVGVTLNSQNNLTSLLGNSFEKTYFDVDIHNGPILINRSGISLGSSSWEIVFNEDSNNKNVIDNHRNKLMDQLPIIKGIVSFNEMVEYEAPIKFNFAEIVIKGQYDLNKAINTGSVTTDKLTFKNNNYQIWTKYIDLKFTQFLKSDKKRVNDIQFSISAKVPDFAFKHRNMAKIIIGEFVYDGNISSRNNLVNSDSTVIFHNRDNSTYPIENSELKLNINDLNVVNVNKFYTHFSEINNLHQQIEWILEDQAELPEGQDQIWQLQNQIDDLYKVLPQLTTKVFNPSDTRIPIFKFSLINHFHNTSSSVQGELQALSVPISLIDASDISLFSLTQAKAKVILDDKLFEYLSSQLPIRDNTFELIFKQNKLLMQ